MDQVFDSQFQAMKAAFAQDGIGIEIAYTPAGGPDYLYQTDRLLIDNRRVSIHEIQRVLPWTRPGSPREQPSVEFLTVLSTAPREGYAYLPVPEALDLLDRELGHKYGGGDGDEKIAESGDYSPVTPVHVLHITQTGASDVGRLCAPVEPEVPCCCPPGRKGREDGEGNEDRARDDCRPCPPPAGDNAGAGVLIGICDTGLLADIAHAPWLAGVTGQTDPLGPLLVGVPPIPDGLHAIPHYTGHGTFAAGMARCQAPGADVYVSHGILTSGAVLETVIVDKLVEMLEHQPAPQVVNLSAGAYTRHDLQLLSFTAFNGGGITLRQTVDNAKLFSAASVFYGKVRYGTTGNNGVITPIALDYAADIGVPTAGSWGSRDTSILADDVRALDARLIQLKKPHDFFIYEDAGHAFFDDTRDSYVAPAASDAWTRTLAWFKRYLA